MVRKATLTERIAINDELRQVCKIILDDRGNETDFCFYLGGASDTAIAKKLGGGLTVDHVGNVRRECFGNLRGHESGSRRPTVTEVADVLGEVILRIDKLERKNEALEAAVKILQVVHPFKQPPAT